MMETQDGAELCFPQLLNTSCRKPPPPGPEAVLLQILLSSMSLLTVVLNLLVIISVSHFRQVQSPSNLLLLSLAVSDFLVGLIVMPSELLRQAACWFLGDIMCFILNYVCFIIVSTSVGDMVLISIDRHLAICYPLHYSTRVSVRRVKVCICLCWIFSCMYGFFIFKDGLNQLGGSTSCYGECALVIDHIAALVDFVVTFILPVTVIIILYLRVFVVAVSQARAMRSHVAAVTHKQSVNIKTKKSELKAARALGVVVVVFIVCLCPYLSITLAGDKFFDSSSVLFLASMFFGNSCVNPVIYALFYPWFRKAVKLIVTLQILWPGSSEANIL